MKLMHMIDDLKFRHYTTKRISTYVVYTAYIEKFSLDFDPVILHLFYEIDYLERG